MSAQERYNAKIKELVTHDSDFEEPPPTCCGGAVPVHDGITILGYFSIVKSTAVAITGSLMMMNGNFFGIYLILFNCVFFMQSYWYYKWIKEDTLETRRSVKHGFLLVLIQQSIFFVGAFLIIYYLPYDALPDKVEDQFGSVYDLPKA